MIHITTLFYVAFMLQHVS